MEKGSASSSSPVSGLKFGETIYFEGVGDSGFQSRAGDGSGSLPPSPAKKGKTGVLLTAHPPRCQVEGCALDLSDAKSYYSRHKVCGSHSKSPMVVVAGLQQRFCQQCSRFHQLPEFDKGKRSCRRRLAGHNERRRKPPPGSLMPSGYGNFSTVFENHSKSSSFTVDFSSYPSLNTPSEQGFGKNQQLPWRPNSPNYLPDLLQGSATRPNYIGHGVSSEDCFNGVSDSGSALSLLSNPPWDSVNRPLSLGINTYTIGATMAPPPINRSATINEYSWSFKGDQSMNQLPPDIRPEHILQPPANQFSEDLDMAQQMHWSL